MGFRRRFFFSASACFNFAFDPFLCQNFLFFHRHFFSPAIVAYPYPYPYYPADYASSQPPYPSDNGYQQGVEQGRLEAEVNGLKDEVSRLTDELARDRAQEAARNQAKRTEPTRPTILVYRDGHQREIQDYAISDQTLWILSGSRAIKVPLSQLDLKATRKANEGRGIDFSLP